MAEESVDPSARSSLSETGRLLVSGKVKAGTFCPIWGAAVEAGTARAWKKPKIEPAENRRAIRTTRELRIFAAMLRGWEKTFFAPITRNARAVMANARLSQGMVFCAGGFRKKTKLQRTAVTAKSRASQRGELRRGLFGEGMTGVV